MKSLLIKYISFLVLILLIGSCEKQISTTQPEEEPGKAQINISSYPDGTKIFVNGKNTGSYTPDSLTFLSEGNYRITLKKELFPDTTFVINLAKDEKKSIFIDYKLNSKMYGNIYCQSNPDKAQIYLNGISTGLSTPNTIKKLWPGEYKLVFKHTTAYEDSLTVIVQGGKTVNANLELNDTSQWVTYNTQNKQFISDYLTAVDIEKSGKLWIGTLDKGVVSIDKNNQKIYYNTSNSPLPANFITDIEVAGDNEIWIATGNGLASFINGFWTIYNSSNTVIQDNYITAVERLGNNIWIGTSNGLVLFEKDKNEWILYDETNSEIPHASISCIGMDKEGLIWFGTNGFGIVRLARTWDSINNRYVESWLNIRSEEIPNSPGNSITAIGIDSDGSRWFGHMRTQTERGGISNLGPSLRILNWHVYFNTLLQDTYFEKIYFEGTTKWICTNNGVMYFQNPNSVNTLRSDNSGLPNSNIRDMCFASNNVIYFASFGGGLIKYKR